MQQNVLITGGGGFIGSNLAVALRQDGYQVTCFDNLSRRGSEILAERVGAHGARFVRGDIRNPGDLDNLTDTYSVMIEASAEPSVLVGSRQEEARFVIDNNLVGSTHCFEFARARRIPVIFLSTSRVYPYSAINQLAFEETPSRFEYRGHDAGVSQNGIRPEFPLIGYRSLYGATKLASELLLQEYSAQYGLPSVINRCGVVAGPWQLGRVDQGVFTYWLARHYFRQPLSYIGFGGEGRQVRDLLHIEDLIRLIKIQIQKVDGFRGEVFNAGGSRVAHLSLAETTDCCRRLTGHSVPLAREPKTRPADVIWFITDNAATEAALGWRPIKSGPEILSDIFSWLQQHETEFKSLFMT